MILCPALMLLLWISKPNSGSAELYFKKTSDDQPKQILQHFPMNDGKLLNRQKRGWMWNQFFLLEEYTGLDYQYVGKLHSDQDKGDKNLKYILSGDGAGTLFVIDETTGDIHATRRIDREEKAFYTLRAQAINRRTGRPVEPESEFVIKIHDINDNEPTFLEHTYTASVPEMSDVGIIRTALPNMNREIKEHYQVVIQAKDMGGQMGGLSGTTTVNINLTDVNDNPPRFTQNTYHLSVSEYSPPGTAVGHIKAVDADIGRNAEVRYRIIDGDEMNMFDITTEKTTQDGVIAIRKKLDYESKRLYSLKVEAENTHIDPHFHYLGPFKDTATVKISVEDADEPPIFGRPSYMFKVHEDIELGTIIGTVMARDPDTISSPIRFSLDRHTDLDRIFNIHSGNGSIYTAKPLDREISQWHNLSIIATEINNPKQTTRATVYILILDVNDNAPQFAMFYDTFVCENARTGQLIQTISAVDKDEPPGGQKFFFSLASVNPNFTVQDNEDNTARILTRRNGFSRHELNTYLLPVVISDNDYPIQSSTGTLTIRVCTCDNQGNMQSCSAEALLLPAGLSTGALIAILLCIVILLLIVVLFAALKRQRKKEPLVLSKEDIRDNIVSYNDEGGGEEDTQAFDIGTLRNPGAMEDKKHRRDIIPENLLLPRRTATVPDNTDVRDFINQRLKEHDNDPTAPPYDSLATYAYEGNDSIAESLSSLESSTTEGDQNYEYLKEWGPRFNKLAEMYGNGESDKDS
ncbi:cadherin-10-like isoform X6 [Bufo gargarizans]|uniref:cadherin-10-like isoform X6 n=1 Tax=Bufo gargarizans TaxID=30331 RepID=UPI001CF1F584|nr:cadherin-10-like isoform X6 [Bufo gargarizans]